MSNYTFKTKLFGLDVEVMGTFEDGEEQTLTDPGLSPAFVIDGIELDTGETILRRKE